MFSTPVRTVLAAVVAVAIGASAAASAQAATPTPSTDYYTIQVKAPGGARDHRLRYLGVETASTNELIKLAEYGPSSVNPKLLWRLKTYRTYEIGDDGKITIDYTSYNFFNMATGNCISYHLPWVDGAGVYQHENDCRSWGLDSGKGKGALVNDKDGQKNGFAIRMIDKCLDLSGANFSVGTPLSLHSCQDTWNQRYFIKLRVRDHRTARAMR
jgi:hypothetical protein